MRENDFNAFIRSAKMQRCKNNALKIYLHLFSRWRAECNFHLKIYEILLFFSNFVG